MNSMFRKSRRSESSSSKEPSSRRVSSRDEDDDDDEPNSGGGLGGMYGMGGGGGPRSSDVDHLMKGIGRPSLDASHKQGLSISNHGGMRNSGGGAKQLMTTMTNRRSSAGRHPIPNLAPQDDEPGGAVVGTTSSSSNRSSSKNERHGTHRDRSQSRSSSRARDRSSSTSRTRSSTTSTTTSNSTTTNDDTSGGRASSSSGRSTSSRKSRPSPATSASASPAPTHQQIGLRKSSSTSDGGGGERSSRRRGSGGDRPSGSSSSRGRSSRDRPGRESSSRRESGSSKASASGRESSRNRGRAMKRDDSKRSTTSSSSSSSKQQHDERKGSSSDTGGNSNNNNNDDDDNNSVSSNSSNSSSKRKSLMDRARSRSRSLSASARRRSRSRSSSRSSRRNLTEGGDGTGGSDAENGGNGPSSRSMGGGGPKPTIVAVTSCRSDAYHHQKAPGSTAMLPRKAPSALKLFHELAVGVKDAYHAMGQTPEQPEVDAEGYIVFLEGEDTAEAEGRNVLWEFMSNLDFLLKLVDEVAVDTATRGALKDDSKFKALRDTIKKCNKVLETMLVRRERKYTLFFRLVNPSDKDDVLQMKKWNHKVEKAVGFITSDDPEDGNGGAGDESGAEDSDGEDDSTVGGGGGSSVASGGTKGSNSIATPFGRTLVPPPQQNTVRTRRATPTPRLRQQNAAGRGGAGGAGGIASSDSSVSSMGDGSADGSAAEDGYSASTVGARTLLAQAGGQKIGGDNMVNTPLSLSNNNAKPIKAKDELIDVIKGLKVEKEIQKSEGGKPRNDPGDIKPNWNPKADIPSIVPRLPKEYIHRHRLMKQAVNCLLSRNGAEDDNNNSNNPNGAAGGGASTVGAGGSSVTGSDAGGGTNNNRNTSFITSITSRHADKVGNGKTTLAVAAIQTVEVRERFCDGISWIKLGRKPLTEKDIRCMYEEIFDQLFSDVYTSMMNAQAESNAAAAAAAEEGGADGNGGGGGGGSGAGGTANRASSNAAMDRLRTARKRFQFGELEGIREDISELVCKRKILLVLDDVWRAEDACWFLFNQGSNMGNNSVDGEKENKGLNGGLSGMIGNSNKNNEPSPFQILITTRFPGLLGAGMAQEVFVRILTEHEAVKLLIASAGKKPQGGKTASIMTESKVVVKGCGNSPLAIRLAGGLLRNKNVFWTLVSPCWSALYAQSKACLSEATQLRSFSKAFGRILDLSFTAIEEPRERASLRRCFVMFAIVFHSNVTVHTRSAGGGAGAGGGNGCSGSQKPGIPRDIVLGLLSVIQASEPTSNVNPKLTAEGLLETLERMNLLERTVILEQSALSGNNSDPDTPENQNNFQTMDDGETTVMNSVAPGVNTTKRRQRVTYSSYSMHDSIAAVAEEMAQRDTPSFAPAEEMENASPEETAPPDLTNTPLRNVGKYLVQLAQRMDSPNCTMSQSQFHELAVASLTGGWTVRTNKQNPIVPLLNDRAGFEFGVEEYLVTYFPSHLIKAKALVSAGEVLVDKTFIRRRIKAMGPIDGTRQHVNDLVELRRALSKSASASKKSGRTPDRGSAGGGGDGADMSTDHGDSNAAAEDTSKMDIGMIMRDSTRRIIDEVYAVDNHDGSSEDDGENDDNKNGENGDKSSNSGRNTPASTDPSRASLNMAICLSTLGEGLLKCRQPRDAMLRLEEAVGMYRSLLGPYHMDVARSLGCVAKALVKLSESRVAVLKFGEAARIYEACDSTHHFDALSNSQSMAALLADLGDYTKAEARYEYVIGIRRSLHGNMNPSVARTLNDYAVVLAKHGKISEAIVQYQEARDAFEGAAASRTTFAFVEAGGEYGFIYDAALIDMNIASIKAKSGDVQGAISSYEEGIQKMRQLDRCARMESSVDGRSKHIIASMGKIGSLKLKLNDKEGALKAYEMVLKECGVNADLTSSTLSTSPTATKTEVAKAHIKCATIRRALMAEDDAYGMRLTHHTKSLDHLKAAFKLYTQLNGLAHRDTQAVAQSLRQWQHEGAGIEQEEAQAAAAAQQQQHSQAGGGGSSGVGGNGGGALKNSSNNASNNAANDSDADSDMTEDS